MIILIQGKQGSGKGTQAKLLAKKFNLFYFSTGDLSRRLAQKDKRIDDLINKKGQLIPTEEMAGYVSEYLGDKLDDVILDGYPRTTRQYKLLSNWIKEKGKKIDVSIFLNISDKEAVRRLSGRRMDPKTGNIYNLVTAPKPGPEIDTKTLIQREDDRPNAIKERLDVYKKDTSPMIKLMKKDRILLEIDGEKPIDVIHKEIVEKLENKLNI